MPGMKKGVVREAGEVGVKHLRGRQEKGTVSRDGGRVTCSGTVRHAAPYR